MYCTGYIFIIHNASYIFWDRVCVKIERTGTYVYKSVVVVWQYCCYNNTIFHLGIIKVEFYLLSPNVQYVMYGRSLLSNLSWMWNKILVATVLCGSLHLYSEFYHECLNESTSWQKKLAGSTVNPLLRESLLLLPPQMNRHLREEKERSALAEIVTGEGGGIFMTTGVLPGHLHYVYPASVVK